MSTMNLMNLGDEELEYVFGNGLQRAGGRCEPVRPVERNWKLGAWSSGAQMRTSDDAILACAKPDRTGRSPLTELKASRRFKTYAAGGAI